MLVFTRFGILVPVFFFITILIAKEFYRLFSEKMGNPDICMVIALLLCAFVTFFIGRKVNNPKKDKSVLNHNTGEQIISKRRSTFLGIPMQWWAIPMVGFAMFIIKNLLASSL